MPSDTRLKTDVYWFSSKESDGREGHSMMDPAELEAQLLLHAEEGDRSRVQSLLRLMMAQIQHFNLNCRCKCRFIKTKRLVFNWLIYVWWWVLVFLTSATALARSDARAGWTPLHLSSHFGHTDVVEDLLKVRQIIFLILRIQKVFLWICFLPWGDRIRGVS